MNTWKTYNKEKLDNTIEVKLYNNKVVSIWNTVGGGTPLNNRGEEINTDDVGWFRAKKDFKRFIKLQKHNEVLEKYSFEKLDAFEFAIWDSYSEQEDKDKIAKLFKKLKSHMERAQDIILTESKLFL